ncbi:protein trichome birefringence-like 4 [Prunus avium]|uniref:Protein trichome birefringence-like 4 n=1 Tax=Prunus avium TaxID=42229 RepID=A0A6P5SX76_PRUAV|nr:protein trichome birefringence-like 4 [Prunus avium]
MADSPQSNPTRHQLHTRLIAESMTIVSPRPSVAHITVPDSTAAMSNTSPPSTKHSSPTKIDPSNFSLLSILFSKRKSMAFTYAFTFAVIACTFFLVFNPLPLRFKSILHASFNSSPQNPNAHLELSRKVDPFAQKPNSSPHLDEIASLKVDEVKNESLKGNYNEDAQSSNPILSLFSESANQTSSNTEIEFSRKVEGSKKRKDTKKPKDSKVRSHSSSKESNGKHGSKKKNDGRKASSKKQGKQTELKSELMNACDIFDGSWVRDNWYPLYAPGSCPLIDEPFNCFLNGRPDNGYERYRWQPKHCNIPRLNGKKMLRLLTGKRLVFVGDSLNRNMWESLLCILRNSVDNKSKVYEVSGREEFRTEGSYSFIFEDYNCSVEFFQSRFLVQEWEMPEPSGSKKETLRIDLIERSSDNYKNADVLIFNTGHWWTHEKTSSGKGYYQEGSHVYGELNVDDAFEKALTTWARWVDTNVNPKKTAVFFRGYSPSHFRGGEWNSGGHCHGETKPTTNMESTEYGGEYPSNMKILDSVVKKMKTPIFYLNITTMTDFRKDAHPSIYRKPNLTEEERKPPMIQDCSHWCLPGVPDTWNELIYAQLLRRNQKQYKQKKQQNQRTPF